MRNYIMPEFSNIKDDFYRYEVTIKCLAVAFDGTFYGRIITIYTHHRTQLDSLLSRWNCRGATHRVIDGCKLPLYQYSIERITL